MKITIALTLFATMLSLIACEQPKPPEEDTQIESTAEKAILGVAKGDVEVIIIEDCEYILYKKTKGNNQGFGFMSHKGNCNNPIHIYQTPDTVEAQQQTIPKN